MQRTDDHAPAVAVVGMACRYAGIESPDALWQRLQMPRQVAAEGLRRMGPVRAELAQFGIPPIYRDSINTLQLHLFELAQQALQQAGLADGGIDAEYTDVIFCSGFGLNRGYENFARIQAQHLAVEFATAAAGDDGHAELLAGKLRQGLQQDFSASSHDKVGEMASSIPARIAGFFKLRGQSMALESLDGGGVQALLAACESLRQGRAKAVLLLAGQGLESELMLEVLAGQGITAELPGPTHAEEGLGGVGEGACALVLKACHQPEPRALAYLGGLYACPAGEEAELAMQRSALCTADLVYVDMLRNCCEARYATMLAATAAAAYRSDAQRKCYWGAAQNATGYTYAASVLTGMLKALLVLGHRQVPPSRDPSDAVARPFTDLLNLILPSQTVALGGGAIAALVAGEDLRGCAFGVRLQSEFPGAATATPVGTAQQPVALVGMGGCFGQAIGLDEYWEYLSGAADSFGSLDGQRFMPQVYRHDDPAAPGSYYIARASAMPLGWLERIQTGLAEQGYGPAQLAACTAAQEAVRSVPATAVGGRVLAVTASNLTLGVEKLAASRYFRQQVVACFRKVSQAQGLAESAVQAGLAAVSRQWALQGEHAPALELLAASGISRLVAEQFGLRAQCVAVEAACAGSLAALDLAVNSLRAGRCDVALVSGVELPVNINDLCLCSSQRMLAPDLIATFSSTASGFTPGDGAGTLVLRRADDLPAGLTARALITALAGSTDAKSMIAPNTEGQVKAMERALVQSPHGTDQIDFIETHGTGTRIGDQVEISSLAQVYRPLPGRTRKLGALKTRFGHCFAAAGMASVIKTVLVMERGQLPANRLRGAVNPELQLAERGFDVLAHTQSWPRPAQGPRRVAINAFGTGGINFHLLMESPPIAAPLPE
ncbi:polyketide synthase [Chitinimonas prasina]|uniref:Polyketide synthase n=1 Tax=Chitinimonas prasina TaxID=1434937 RepID=A0ABQ5YDW2_9NEIS|nr:polyketide synthase [Chitinimonas prasina]GLR11772.1 polyketide synthase [Chitinimonas prasina]